MKAIINGCSALQHDDKFISIHYVNCEKPAKMMNLKFTVRSELDQSAAVSFSK